MAWLHKNIGLCTLISLAVIGGLWIVLALAFLFGSDARAKLPGLIVSGVVTAAFLAALALVNRYFRRLFTKVEAQGDYIVFHRRRKQILIKKTTFRIVEEQPAVCLFFLSDGKVLECPKLYAFTKEPILHLNVINKVNFPNAKLK